MSDLRSLYQEIILDHNKNPRNFRKLEHPDRVAEGYNPLCGDRYTIYLKLEGDKIGEVTFEGSGCAISKASASVMCVMLKGKTREEALKLFETFHKLVTGELNGVHDIDSLGKIAAFSGVSEFPVRVKCASLAWHTVKSALESKTGVVSTE